jgi:TP901 family phage tail tape measure protein
VSNRSSSIDVFLRLHNQRKFNKELVSSGVVLERALGVKGARAMTSFAAAADKYKSFGRKWTRNVSLPLSLAAGFAVKSAIDQESSFAGVRKTINDTEAGYKRLELGLRGMSLKIPVSANELNEIAEAAGQLGIQRKAILGFTRVVADLGVATNLKGDEGATILARFANITQMPQSQFDRLGSSIVALGNAGASTESDIASMGLRIAAAGNYVGMSEPQILGYANALSSVGIEAEAGGTAISTSFKVINSAVAAGGDKLEAFARIAGMSSGQFKKAWEHDAADASVAWIEGLARLKKEGEDVPAVLKDLDPKLGAARVQDTLLRASGAGALLRESLALGERSWRENNALTKEANQRYETLESQLQILKNEAVDLGVTFGQELLPAVAGFAEFAGPKLQGAAHLFGSLSPDMKSAAVGATALLVAVGPLTSAVGYLAGGVGRTAVAMARFQRGTSSFLEILGSARSAGQGWRSLPIAFEGTGAAGALQTAKGFALSLGPALAAYGIGNIATSALEGDWKDAGFEAGGAIAGGIAGFMLGGPFGAMIGVGLGSLGGELISGLFGGSEEKTLQDEIRARLKGVAQAMESQRASGKALADASGQVVKWQHRQKAAAQEVHAAENALAATRRRFPGDSQAVIKAEIHLAKATERVTRAKQAQKRAERLKGVNRQIAKEDLRYSTLQLRSLKSRLRDERYGLLSHRDALKKQGATMKELRPVNEALTKNFDRLGDANKKLADTARQASEQVGPRFAGFLRDASDEALRLGSNVKVAAKNLRLLTEQEEAYMAARESGYSTIQELEAGGPRTAPSLETPGLPGGLHMPPKHGPKAGPPSPHRKGKRGNPPFRASSGGGNTVIEIPLVVDGRELARVVHDHDEWKKNRE